MTDYSDLISQNYGPSNPALPTTVGNIDEDPDKAQRAIDLSKATGVAPTNIYGDLEEFERQHKAVLASDIVANNPHLSDYVQSNPMAARISNDDYGQLDATSSAVTKMSLPMRVLRAPEALAGMLFPGDPLKHFKDQGPIGSWLSSDDIKNYSIASAIAAGLGTPIDLIFKGLGGAIETVAEAGVESGTAIGGPGLGREVGAVAQTELMGLSGRHAVHGPEDPMARARPYLENGREPPPTVLPEYDKFLADRNKDDVDALKEATSEAQASLTRDRSPEMFRSFIAQHTDAEIGIGGDAVAGLYGDKVPTPDDGLLGWVPGIEDKLALARETGADVSVPLADWLTHAEPETMQALHDDIRVRPGGITANEVKAASEAQEERTALEEKLNAERETINKAAIKFPTGEVTEGQFHFEALQNGQDQGLKWKQGERYEEGFTTSQGRFVNREEALKIAKANDQVKPYEQNPEYKELMSGELKPAKSYLDAADLQEAKPITLKESEPLPEEVPSLRAATALEPLFSVGDRKLELQRMEQTKGTRFGVAEGFHDFNMVDENGQTIGALNISEQKGGKQLYVDNITGVNGLGPNDFGPALIRHIARQIKAEFPAAFGPDGLGISGHRVSGAREAAGKEMTMPEAQVKFDRISDENRFRQILEGGQWETYSPNIQGFIKPDALRSEADRQLVNIVNNELDRIVPQKTAIQGVDTIKVGGQGLEGQRPGEAIRAGGVYIRYKETYPIILYALDGENALGAARHEAIHHLRSYGFFKPEEWETLQNEALAGGWLSKYKIDSRYPTAKPELKLEEAIAEAYQDWAGQKDSLTDRAKSLMGIESPLDTIFRKMKEFFDRIKDRVGALLGKDPQWEDVFKRVDTGEVGGREGTQPLDARAFNEKLSVSEEPEGGSRVFERASALGMTVDQFKGLDKAMQAQHAADIAAETKRAEDFQRKTQTKEWKDNRRELRQDISREITQRPDVAADLFFATGELYGKKISSGYKLDTDQLSPEQRAAIPKDYQARGGLNPDDVANIFGYGSGDAMLARLAEYNGAKKATGLGAKDFVVRVTDIEADRQMRLKYGVLEDNIIDSVKEQVASEASLNVLHEETMALGMRIGQGPLTKEAILKDLRAMYSKMSLGSVSSDAYFRAAGKAGRISEAARWKGDAQGEFRAKQQQYYAMVIANEALKTEKSLAQFDKVAKRFSKREVATIDQEYTNFIHDILMRVGKSVRRSVQDLETEIAAGEYKSLPEFVEGKETHGLREVPVADILLDPNFRKKFEDLTVDEFNATNDSIKTLIKNGRDEKKIVKAGVEADLSDIRKQMIDQLSEFQERTYDAKGGRWMGPIPPSIAKVLRTYGVAHIQIENLFNRWDHDNPRGVFQQYVMRDLADAANNESAMEKRFAGRMREVDDGADLKKGVDNNLFKVPGTEQFVKMNRGNLRTVLMNMGNESNMSKLARGYGIKPEQLWAWVNQHATKADWDWAQKMGDVFKEIKGEADVMYRNLSGVAPESLEIKPVQTMHGEYEGWYYPVIYHPEFEGASKKLMGKDALEQKGFVRATTPAGYTKGRTGYAGPMALDLDMLPARMKQMIHDVAMRPAVINASKIFYDKDVRGAIFKHFGAEWRDMLVPYLVDVANSANYMPKQQRIFTGVSEFIRQNMISTLVGLNPGTVLKHGPTAAVQSLHEVGPINFLKATKSLFSINERTGETNWQFAMRESDELQRRHRNYEETLGGTVNQMMPTNQFMTLRQTVQKFSATPVAISDLMSAVPTWLARYETSMDEGGTHGDAVFDANRAVRRAHGSTAITNRSQVMRGGAMSQWMASVYGFFSHIMNRQYELLWKAGETMDLAKDGQYREAMQRAPELTSMLFAYVLAPALIEEMVTPLVSKDDESWGKKAAKGIAFTLGASWVGIRDVASAILNGRDPSVGLFSTAYKTVSDVARDLSKNAPLSKEHAGKVIRDGSTMLGALTGVVPGQVGKTAQFGYGVAQGTERPKGPWGWMVGARFGTLKNHSGTFQEWQRHH